MKNRWILYLVSVGALVIGFALIRFLLFGLHGMKQWPLILMLLCLAVIIISFIVKAKTTSIASACPVFLTDPVVVAGPDFPERE